MSRFTPFNNEERALIALGLATSLTISTDTAAASGIRDPGEVILLTIDLMNELGASFDPPLGGVDPEIRQRILEKVEAGRE